MESILLVFCFMVEAFALLIICHYDSLHGSRPALALVAWPTVAKAPTDLPIIMACSPTTVLLSLRRHIPQGVDSLNKNALLEIVHQATLDPTPTTFVAAISIFTLAILFTHHLSQRHRFQNQFSICGVCVGAAISGTKIVICPGPLVAMEFWQTLLWSWLICSIVGAVAHRCIGGTTLRDESEYKDISEIEKDKREREKGSLM